jgi:hypothetical protein
MILADTLERLTSGGKQSLGKRGFSAAGGKLRPEKELNKK